MPSPRMKFPRIFGELFYEPDVPSFSEDSSLRNAHGKDEMIDTDCGNQTMTPLRRVFYTKRRSLDLKRLSNVVLIGLVRIQEGNRK